MIDHDDDQIVTDGHITTPVFAGVLGRLTFRFVGDPATGRMTLDQSKSGYRMVGVTAHPDSEVPIDKIADAVGDRATRVKCLSCGAILAVFKPGALDASVGPLDVACPACGRHRRIVPPKPKGSRT